jgi:hypothetical protein
LTHSLAPVSLPAHRAERALTPDLPGWASFF